MNAITAWAGTLLDLALVIFGFGLIVFVHELGHFLAARWAGIRVLAFALGFGPAVLSYRKGLGWRRGSSADEAAQRLRLDPSAAQRLSPTEYRLNALPFGGYVKMLGQEDLNPGAVSAAPDSYQHVRPWKRMVVISAGVVFNLITAALLFVFVFMAGLRTEPALIGDVLPGSPAARAQPVGAPADVAPGLRTGDRFVAINGRTPNSFHDVVLATAMTRPGAVMRVRVEREGHAQPLGFEIKPERDRASRLFQIGVEPSMTGTLPQIGGPPERAGFDAIVAQVGLSGVEPGSRLAAIADRRGDLTPHDLERAVAGSGGAPIRVAFTTPDGREQSFDLRPIAGLQSQRVPLPEPGAGEFEQEHLLGLTPVMTVEDPDQAAAKGLRRGDLFVRLGSAEFPSPAQAIAECRRHARRTIDAVVRRPDPATGQMVDVELELAVSRAGTIGFRIGTTDATSTLLSLPLAVVADRPSAAAGLAPLPGSTVAAINGRAVTNFTELREALRDATREAHAAGAESAVVRVNLAPPTPVGPGADPTPPPARTHEWTLSRADLADLHALGWRSPVPAWFFEPQKVTLRASGPLEALGMGLSETRRVMLNTYLTFARLLQGGVRVEHLNGPIGIAHLGSRIAERGPVWLLFFFALISINLAVVNFLPIPITDGGHMLFLLYEQVSGRPVSILVQNIATLAGLAIIGTMFVIVTFNDLARLLGG